MVIGPLLLLAPSLMRLPITTQDEGQLLTYPDLLLRGYTANTDFSYVYGINNISALAAAYDVFGVSLVVERMVSLVGRLVLVAALTDMVRRVGGAAVAVIAGWGSMLILAYIGLGSFAWINAVAVALVAVWLATNLSTSRTWIASGLPWVFVGLAIGFRIDIALACAAVLVAQFLRRPPRAVIGAVAGLALGLAPVYIHVFTAENVVNDMIVSPILRGGGRRLPLLPASRFLLTFELLVFAALAVTALALLVLRHRSTESSYRNLAALGALSVALVPQMLQRLDSIHLAYVACVILPCGLAAASLLVRTGTLGWGAGGRQRIVWSVAALLAVGLARFSVIPIMIEPLRHARTVHLTGTSSSVTVANAGRSVVVASEDGPDLDALILAITRVSSADCDRLFVGPADLRFARYGDTFLYFLLPQLSPASRYLEFNPGEANADDSSLATDLSTADIVVLNDFEEPPEANDSNVPGPSEPNDVVADRFVEVARFGVRTLLTTPECARGS